MANIISYAYKGSILSTLIAIRYEEPLDTIEQMVDSGLPYYVFGNSAGVWVTKTDPRNMIVLDLIAIFTIRPKPDIRFLK